MSVLEAVVLGIVQGLTEFLPISSKSHLIIIPALFGWESPPIPYVVFLHAGTLLAALFYFRNEILETLEGLDRPSAGRKMIFLLAIATIPAAAVGFFFEKPITNLFDHPALAAGLLVVTGIILATTETVFRSKPQTGDVEESSFSNVEKMTAEITPAKSLFIGVAQVLALLPGISRAGSTIGAGLLAKLSRPQAARFSFMMSIPIIAG
ncbi:MAG: undecaprenyl-diphosphate phosphatase, partial [Actinomycetota bacterium]